MSGARLRVTLAVLLGAAAFVAAPGLAGAACQQWTGAQPPMPGDDDAELHGVVVPSRCSAWAVGSYRDGGAPARALVEKWNGSAWRQVTIPQSGTTDSLAAADGSWAVGSFADSFRKTLVVRRVGSSWAVFPSPNPSSNDNELQGVTEISAGNAWAVGWYHDGTTDRTLVLHWNGRKWRRVASPNAGDAGTSNQLFSVDARSANDIWAVGFFGNVSQTLVLHWNGKKWSRAASPHPGDDPFGDALLGVSAVSADDAWAVGNYAEAMSNEPLLLHWNGRKWRRMATPNPANNAVLSAVRAFSKRNVWAVGAAGDTFVIHWNGRAWRRVNVQSPSANDNVLYAIGASSTGNIWAVGSYRDPGFVYEPLALHCC